MDTLQQLQSPETERALLGSIIMDPEILRGLDIRADDFYGQTNRIIFNVIDSLADQQEAIDYITICGELDKRKLLSEIGGPAYITKLVSTPGMSWAVPTYAKELRDKARRRDLLKLANQIAMSAHDQNLSIDETIPSFVNCLVDVSSVNHGARPLSEAMSELYDEVNDRMLNPSDIWGIPTGFPTFDNATGGLQQSELLIIAGAPGVGKSILGMDFAANMAKHAPGAIYSMEMKRKQVARRLVSGYSGIRTRSMKTGKIAEEELPVFTNAIEYFSSLPVHIDDSQGWTTTSLRADLARLKAQFGIKWFVLDYLFLLNDGGDDEIERTQAASKGLKRATNELDLAGIAIHSLNKTGMNTGRNAETGGDGLPMGLGDMRGSAQVAYDTDLACFLTKYNPDALPELKDVVPQNMRDYTRILWFGKGRELENPRQYVPLMQRMTKKGNQPPTAIYPAFVEVETKHEYK